ncbi:serine hydrolase [Candidatus Dependentiae bacterium]|nr:serine hydrolase [Candidatus Dependentiae bacterium]
MLKKISKIIFILIIVFKFYGCGSSDVSVTQTNYEQLKTEMRSFINLQLAANDIGGITLAFVDEQNTVWLEGFGYADIINTAPVTPETVFSIGSVSKTMAAILIMTLVEQGKIDLDKPLTTYLPEFSINQRFPNSVITIRSILAHHSGLPGDILTGAFTKTLDRNWSSWLLDYLKDEYTLQPVGGVWGYNNSGYVILEKVIERVSGMTLEDYSKQYLFNKAGMTSASWFFDTSIQTNVAYPYYAGTQYEREMTNASTAGSVSMNALDMAKYLKLQLAQGEGVNGTVISKNTFNEMLQQQYADNPLDLQLRMGLGWLLNQSSLDYAGSLMWHNGATIVYNSDCIILREHGLAVFIASNSPDGSSVIEEIAVQILKKALEIKKGITVPPPQNPVLSQSFYRTHNDLAQYNGIYAGGQLGYDTITAKDNYLEWTRNLADTAASSVLILTPLMNGRFTLNDSQTKQIEFANIAGRNVMVYYNWGITNTFEKYILAEKFNPPIISAAWNNRLGNYTLVNASNDDFINIFELPSFELKKQNDLLIMGEYVLDINSDTLAFTSGLYLGLSRNRGAAIRIETDISCETLWFMGAPFRKQ